MLGSDAEDEPGDEVPGLDVGKKEGPWIDKVENAYKL